jgi:predicted dinucleotide-binding enzyme
MQIAVIGYGNIGGTLARKWAAAGHQVVIGAREPNKPDVQQLCNEIGPKARAADITQATTQAEAVVFAVPGGAMTDTLRSVGQALNGKLVIDATNNIGAAQSGGQINSVQAIEKAAPQAKVYRAFNIYGFENLAEPVLGGVQADMFYAGSDGDARAQAEQLIRDVGLNPVWLGGSDKAELVDQFLRIWFTLAFEQNKGRRMAFKLLR